MNRHIKFAAKCCIFLVIISIVVVHLNQIFLPKELGEWPTTMSEDAFYSLKKNSIDVLFLGSSHAVNGFNPQELYNQYQITSYNLGCEQQNLVTSYYWLKEALKYQNPKVVVLDTYFLFPYDDNQRIMNFDEPYLRKSFDYMRWSENKLNAVRDICRIDPEQSAVSYFLSNIRFHSRWNDLDRDDFSYKEREKKYILKGLGMLSIHCNNNSYHGIDISESVNREPMLDTMVPYLEKIYNLCREQNIELLLVKTPSQYSTVEQHNTIQDYADERQIRFIDLNEMSVMQEMQYNFHDDNGHGEHANIWGSIKIAQYLGKVLQEKYQLSGHIEPEWEADNELYFQMVRQAELVQCNDLIQYMQYLKNDNYVTLVSVKIDAAAYFPEEAYQPMSELGLQVNLSNQYGMSYLAVIDQGKAVTEQCASELLEYYGTAMDGEITYCIISGGRDSEKATSSIIINDEEYSFNKSGINIAVIDRKSGDVIDNVFFATHDEDYQGRRKIEK